MRFLLSTGLLISFFTASAQEKLYRYTDHHVHLQNAETVELGYRMLAAFHETPKKIDSVVLTADTIIQRLNKASFKSAWILSNAYWYGSPLTPIENEYAEVKRENDWTADEVARYPDRLFAFMSINPLKPYALEEIQRCADSRRFYGLKLHFANSKINLSDEEQVKQLQKVFALANKYHLTMLVHFRSGQQWDGRVNTQILLEKLMPFAKNTTVVIAHMAGWGGYDEPMDAALGLFGHYIHRAGNTRIPLYLEVSGVLPFSLNEDYHPSTGKSDWNSGAALKKGVRQIGTNNILFGTDWPLIEIDPYIHLLEQELGSRTVQQILKTTVPINP